MLLFVMMMVNTQDNAADDQSRPGRDLATGNDQPSSVRDESVGIPSPAAIPTESSYSFPTTVPCVNGVLVLTSMGAQPQPAARRHRGAPVTP